MANQYITLPTDTSNAGKKVQTHENTVGGQVVQAHANVPVTSAGVEILPALDATLTGGTQKTKLVDTGGTNVASVSAGGALKVDGSAATQPVSAASLPLPSGAATDASVLTQSLIDNAGFTDGTTRVSPAGYIFDETAGTALTENDAAAARVDSKRAQVHVIEDTTTRGQRLTITAANAAKVDGSAVTQPVSGTVAISTALALDATLAKLTVAQGAALGSNTQVLAGASVTTAAPAYTTGQISPLSLTTTGLLRTDGSGVTQPVSGTIAANQGGTWTVQPGNTANTTPWLVTGDVDHDAVNTLKNIQAAGHASPVKTTPTAVSATGDRVRFWSDQYGRVITTARKLATYSAFYRLAVTNAEADFTFTHVANTDKQYATIYHAASAVKLVKVRRVVLWIDNVATAAGIFFAELRRLNLTTAPATGNPAITPLAYNTVDGAAEATCLCLPTTAGSEAAANSPIMSCRVDSGITAASPTTNPLALSTTGLTLWDDTQGGSNDEIDFLTMRNGVAEGYAVIVRSSAASVTRARVQIVFTEETP